MLFLTETIPFSRYNIKLLESAADVNEAVEVMHKGSDTIVRNVLDMDKCVANWDGPRALQMQDLEHFLFSQIRIVIA